MLLPSSVLCHFCNLFVQLSPTVAVSVLFSWAFNTCLAAACQHALHSTSFLPACAPAFDPAPHAPRFPLTPLGGVLSLDCVARNAIVCMLSQWQRFHEKLHEWNSALGFSVAFNLVEVAHKGLWRLCILQMTLKNAKTRTKNRRMLVYATICFIRASPRVIVRTKP